MCEAQNEPLLDILCDISSNVLVYCRDPPSVLISSDKYSIRLSV